MIRPRKLSDAVQDRLLRHIRENGLAPGDVLPSERELMARYEIGRPAIREAMQSLQHMGVIEIRHGGRPRIASPSLDGLIAQMGTSMQHLLLHSESSMDHLKEARIALESQMAGIAAQRASATDVLALTEILARQRASTSDPEMFLELDGQFHRKIAAISRNPIFETLCFAVFTWLRAFHVEQVRSRGLEALTLAEHQAILDAILNADRDGAIMCMRAHIERANALYHQENAS